MTIRRPPDKFACTYCGKEYFSHNGMGSDVSCCGEVGHVNPMVNWDSIGPYYVYEKQTENETTAG
jgi:hypothetical protein